MLNGKQTPRINSGLGQSLDQETYGKYRAQLIQEYHLPWSHQIGILLAHRFELISPIGCTADNIS